MAKKANNYINTELIWAEEQLKSWKAYIDKNPLHELKDRIELKPTSKGGTMPMVIASIEQQLKAITELMTKYLQLLQVVDDLRQKEENKIEARGKGVVVGQAAEWIKDRNG